MRASSPMAPETDQAIALEMQKYAAAFNECFARCGHGFWNTCTKTMQQLSYW